MNIRINIIVLLHNMLTFSFYDSVSLTMQGYGQVIQTNRDKPNGAVTEK